MPLTEAQLARLRRAPHGVCEPRPALFFTATTGARLDLFTAQVTDRFGPRPLQATGLVARRGTGFLLTTLATFGAN